MDRYKVLQQEKADLALEARTIYERQRAESRDLTDPENERLDQVAARANAVDDELDVLEARRERDRKLGALQPDPRPRITDVHDRAEDEPWGSKTGRPLGEFLQAVARVETHKHAPWDPRLHAVAQGANENVGSDGGFLVGTDRVDRIMLRVTAGEVMSRTFEYPVSAESNSIEITLVDETSRATGSRFGGVQGYWVDEGAAITASRPKFYLQGMRLRKVAALGYATDEVLADAARLETVMTDTFAQELRFQTEDAFIEGTGAGQPLGILNSGALISVAKESGQAAASVVVENINNMWARLPAASRANAVWFINQDVEPQLESMGFTVGVGGVPAWLPPGGLADTPYARLKGRPVIPIEYASTVGTVGDIILADMSHYIRATKVGQGPQVATSMHVAFTTDEMAFRVTYRVDGAPDLRVPLTPFKGTATQSPFVALATRA